MNHCKRVIHYPIKAREKSTEKCKNNFDSVLLLFVNKLLFVAVLIPL